MPPPVSERRRTSTRADPDTVTFSLISHTNVGKTTLARTLLRRDVGDAIDQPHVTDVSQAYPMIEAGGRRLVLWDTPGFGDTGRLLKRLRHSGHPIRWLISQLWDRFRDRPLWCSQQAVRNVQEEADVVLYLVNASEKPSEAGYVAMEMEILTWIGRPVVLLLNQTGPPRAPVEEDLEEAEWRFHLSNCPVVKAVIGLDAFARCWVQEGKLLDLIAPLLPEEKQPAYAELREAWQEENRRIFRMSREAIAAQLTDNVLDRETVSRETFLQRLGVGRSALNADMERARSRLTERLTERSMRVMNELIRLHGLEGHSRGGHPLAVAGADLGVPEKVNESLWSAVGGLLSGAAAGFAADLHAGGLSLGGGAIAGMLLGGAGSYLLARGFNLTRGEDSSVRWTSDHFAAQTELALLCYLAVAHYGRGRGEWQDSEHPPVWRETVRAVLQEYRKAIDAVWKSAGAAEPDTAEVSSSLNRILGEMLLALLRRLYPSVRLPDP